MYLFKWKPSTTFKIYSPKNILVLDTPNDPLPTNSSPSKFKKIISSIFKIPSVLFNSVTLPSHTTHVWFVDEANPHAIIYPSSISHIYLNSISSIPSKMPSSLTHLTFGREFNSEVNNLPSSITHITFGDSFNKQVNNLPSSLTHVVFGGSFSKSIDNLPKKVVFIILGRMYLNTHFSFPSSINTYFLLIFYFVVLFLIFPIQFLI